VELDACPCLPELESLGDHSRAGTHKKWMAGWWEVLSWKLWWKKLWLLSAIGPNSSGKKRRQLDCCLCQQLIWMLFGVERQHLKLPEEFNPRLKS